MLNLFPVHKSCVHYEKYWTRELEGKGLEELEHLPYKQGVGGSSPSSPTQSLTNVRLFF